MTRMVTDRTEHYSYNTYTMCQLYRTLLSFLLSPLFLFWLAEGVQRKFAITGLGNTRKKKISFETTLRKVTSVRHDQQYVINQSRTKNFLNHRTRQCIEFYNAYRIHHVCHLLYISTISLHCLHVIYGRRSHLFLNLEFNLMNCEPH